MEPTLNRKKIDMTSFEALGVGAPILRALEHIGFTEPTEIQAAAIPSLMNAQDLIGVAQTGGGKTAAFVIPMLERLAGHAERPKPGMPRALILAPTRELAIQITDKIKELAVGSNARCCTVYGGAPYKTQIHILRRGVDILVATPGRLKDHMKQGNIYLDEVEYFVLDEADRMLDMGFVDEVRDIARKLPVGHQSVMFSATMNAKVTELAKTLLQDAVRVEVARQATIADNLEHKIMFVPGHKKNDLLLDLIEEEQPTKTLVFVRTRRDADQMCEYLEAVGFTADSIHGDKKQNVRQRTINNFKVGKFDFLVATDVAARGIDVTDISHVFNMDVPVEAESYVHRIGRTARGGAHGRAITLCGKNELRLLRDIEALIEMKIPVDDNHPYPLPLNKPRAGQRPGGRGNGSRGDNRRSEGRRSEGRRTDGRRGDSRRSEGRGSERRGEGNRRADARPPKRENIKPWDKRAKKRAAKANGDQAAPAAANWDPVESQAEAPKAASKPGKSGDKAPAQKAWAKRADDKVKPAGKKTKRVDPSANKRKSKAGAKAAAKKKRPAVAARKAKAQQTKSFRKPAKGGASNGGNVPLRRRAH